MPEVSPDVDSLLTSADDPQFRSRGDLTFAAYGNLGLSAATAPAWNLGAGWQTLDVFDQEMSNPRHITQNLTNNSLMVDTAGVFLLVLNGSFEHDSSASGRTTNVRLFNLTDGTPSANTFGIGIGRNSEVTNIPLIVPFELGAADINDEIQVQLGGGDVVTVGDFLAVNYAIFSIGV